MQFRLEIVLRRCDGGVVAEWIAAEHRAASDLTEQ
jgi:hypothetical protein